MGVDPIGPKNNKLLRKAAHTAKLLDMDAGDVAAIIRRSGSSATIAELLGLKRKEVAEVRRVFAAITQKPGTSNASSSSKSKPASKPTKSSDASFGTSLRTPLLQGPQTRMVINRPDSVPPIPVCGSCGHPIGPNGACGC